METKHFSRVAAEKKLAAASAALRTFNGNGEAEFLALESAFKAAAAELVAAEIAHPTVREINRKTNRIRLENRGLAA
jgi:hypothetical protein